MNKRTWETLTDEQKKEWILAQPYSRGKIHTFDGEPAKSNKAPSRRDMWRAEVASRRNR